MSRGSSSCPRRCASELGERLSRRCREIVLARRVSADGRTRAYLNGRAAPSPSCATLGGTLLAFYGQHEHRKLTLSAAQLKILDGLCGAEHDSAPARVRGRVRARRARSRRARRSCASSPRSATASSTCSSTSCRDRLARSRRARARGAAGSTRAPAPPRRAALRRGRRRRRARAGRRREPPAAPSSRRPQARAGCADGCRSARWTPWPSACARSRSSPRTWPPSCASTASGQRRRLEDLGERGHGVRSTEIEERLAVIERLARKHGGSIAAVLELRARGARAARRAAPAPRSRSRKVPSS